MSEVRPTKKVLRSKPTVEGAGVHLKRAFGYHQVPQFDPFLLLDDFHSDNPQEYSPGFPWHPHRGIETITYVLRGSIEHGDSLGNAGIISSGDVQWMTAGSGIVHQEMPKAPPDGVLWGFQLWANLPASKKMMAPRYREVRQDEIPVVELPGGIAVRIICGTVAGVRGPVRDIVTEPRYLDVAVPGSATFTLAEPARHTVFAYVLGGEGRFGGTEDPFAYEMDGRNYFDYEGDITIGPESVVLFGDGDLVQASAGDRGVRFLLVSGSPIGEPVAWGGPIVMNTNDELRRAFQEYRDGTFLKH